MVVIPTTSAMQRSHHAHGAEAADKRITQEERQVQISSIMGMEKQ